MVTSLSCIDYVSDLDIVQYVIAGVQPGGGVCSKVVCCRVVAVSGVGAGKV